MFARAGKHELVSPAWRGSKSPHPAPARLAPRTATTVELPRSRTGVQRMIRRVAEASIRVEVVTAVDPGDILADRHQIEQVLLNLAINACDAMGNRERAR